jgi:predicted transport protein
MALYQHQSGKLKEVKEKPFKLEKDIQKVFEQNLSALMGLELVKSEFAIKNKRIDTLAYDAQACAFIIIEYKRDKNISVVDQGFTYLSLLLENKADFIVEYNESLKRNLKREDVDWSQTRVAFVSTSFTENQIQATNFKDIAIELWVVKQYENDTISINHIKKSNSAESIKPITRQTESLNSIATEIKVYTEQDHIEKASEVTRELYEKFKSAVFNLASDVSVVPLKYWLNFDKGSLTLVSMEIQKKKLNITINKKAGHLDDSKSLARDVSKIGHYGKGDYQVQVEDDADLEYIMSLAKQTM